MKAAGLLTQYAHLFTDNDPVLDLASGRGRNGLYLHQKNIPTIFADRNRDALNTIKSNQGITEDQIWHVDLESDINQLPSEKYQGIIVFNYLHRPLFTDIKRAIKSGGYLIYETFTVNNRQFGRPNRDAFLLQEDELNNEFSDWECMHYFEGIQTNPDRAIAQIVCRKP